MDDKDPDRNAIIERLRPSSALIHLIGVALVSRKFRAALLADPALAISDGYRGEPFGLAPDEYARLAGIHATSLASFALQALLISGCPDDYDSP